MRKLLFLLFVFCLCGSLKAQQNNIREVNKFSDLVNHVQDVSRTRFVKGYSIQGDGGQGFFVWTNTAIFTNTGTRIKVTGQAYSWERVHDGNIDIRWFGAVDGALDSTAAIQAAIDYAALHDFTVVIPAGEYGIVSTINLKDNTKIVGSSSKSVLFGQATTVSVSSSSRTNVLLRDLLLGGTSATQLKLDSSKNVKLERVSVTGASINFGSLTAGIWIEGGGNITLDNVRWYGNGLPASTNQGDYNLVVNFGGSLTTNLTIINPTVENLSSKCGLCMFGVNNPTVTDGYVNMNNQGTVANNNGYGIIFYGFDGAPVRDISISRTAITNTYGTAVYLRNAIGGSVTDLKINKSSLLQSDVSLPAGAIVVNIASDIRVINSGITNSGINSGIVLCDTTNCIVAVNTIYLPATNHWGIELRGTNFGPSIKGNTILNGHRGIGNTLVNGVVIGGDIEGNVIKNFADGIVMLAGSSNNVVRANRIFNNSLTGIYDFGTYNTIANNIIIGGVVGIYAAGSDGLILPNEIQGQVTGLSLIGSGYRVDPIGRYHDNTTPINDAGGNIVKTITAGTTPSVKDAPSYVFNYPAPVTVTDFTDGLPGMRRTFFTVNTNATIAHSASINLEGSDNFNMKQGDTLTLERNAAGGWRQVGKAINGNFIYYNRGAETLTFNVPIYDLAAYVQQTTPSTSLYAHQTLLSTNTTANALIATWGALGNNNGYTIRTSADKTNYVFGYNGIEQIPPRTNGVAGQVLATDGATPQKLYWTNSSGSGGFTFEPTQFGLTGGYVFITNGALTTNIVLKGAVTSPTLNVTGVNIDAATGTEFSKTLASNTSMGIINMTNDQTIHITYTNTTFTLSFTNTDITWLSGVTPVINTNAVNVYHFSKKGGRIFGSDPEQLANANAVGLASMAGTGVVVKTNTTTFVTFDPLPIRYGGTGTNFYSSIATGNIIFYDLANDQFDADDSRFVYDKAQHTLYLNRDIPGVSPQLFIYQSSGVVPVLSFYDNKIQEDNDDLTISIAPTHNLLAQVNSITAFKVSSDLSTVIGDGTTTTTRTNKFLYIPTTLGTPTGTPHPETGVVAMNYDTSNNHLYVYDAGWQQIDGGGGLTFTGSVNGVVYSPNGSTLTNNPNFVFSPTGISPTITITNGVQIATFGLDSIGNTLVRTFNTGITLDGNVGVNGYIAPSTSSKDLGTTLSNSQWRDLFLTRNISWNGTTNTVFDSAGNGSPEGVKTAAIGSLYRDYANGVIYVKVTGASNTGWVALATSFDGWTLSIGTNSTASGNAYANIIAGTNGVFTGPGLNSFFSNVGLSMLNSGSSAVVVNNSITRLTNLKLQGGTGAESYVAVATGGGTVKWIWETNGIAKAYYGIHSDNLIVTNSSTVGAGTSGSFARVGGVLHINRTSVGNNGTGEDNLQTFPVPANTLSTDLDTIRFRCAGGFASNGNTKQVKVYFGSTLLFATGALAFNASSWVLTAEITRDSNTTQLSNVQWTSDSTLLSGSAKVDAPNETLSGAVTFKVTGEGTSSLDIYQRTTVAELLPTP